MALRSPAVWMGDPAVQTPASEDRLLLGALFRADPAATAASRPLAASSGALYGPAGTMGEVTLLSNTQFTINPARWVIQAASALGGIYVATNDAVSTLSVTAQDATQSRRSYLGVWVADKFVAGSGDNLPHWGLVDGPLAASNPQLPAAGALPANWLALGEFLIPPVGQAVTWTPYNAWTGLRGGTVPIAAEASLRNPTTGATVLNGAFPGQQYYCLDTKALAIWDAAAGLWRMFDTDWRTYTPVLGAGFTPGTNGTNLGFYMRRGRAWEIRIHMAIGTVGANGGSGTWSWSLPPGFTPATVPTEQPIFCKGYNSLGNIVGIAQLSGSTMVVLGPTSAGNVGCNLYSGTQPGVWNPGSNLQFSGTLIGAV